MTTTQILPWREGTRKAAAILKRGGVVAFPTETYYGLAADPRNEEALRRIFAIKRRDDALQLPLLGGHESDVFSLTSSPHALVLPLVHDGWPGAFSAILENPVGLPSLFRSGVAFRVSPHPVAAHLVRLFGFPVTSTSANVHGAPAVCTAAECSSLGVDLVLDGGTTPGGLPSTLARPAEDGWQVLRQGPVTPGSWPVTDPVPGWTRDLIPACDAFTYQPASGNRFTLDSILLCHFAKTVGPSRIKSFLDLGAGTGVCAFWLHQHLEKALGRALELDADAVSAARTAAAEQHLRCGIEFIAGDLAWEEQMLPGCSFDLVVSNPPFFTDGGTRVSPDPGRRAARHDESGFLGRALQCTSRVLRPGGKGVLVLPADRLQGTLTAASASSLHLTNLRMVHPRAGEPANRVLLAFVKARRTRPVTHPPLFVYDDRGYGTELREILHMK
ncbi:Sua5/YciO/YrdC/YwlC family protein [Myxococcota bacterium]|nr:Sua5/YciO/YrdC/YwlC family protein [Myxococcota bacterium]